MDWQVFCATDAVFRWHAKRPRALASTRWILLGGFPGFRKRIQHVQVVILQPFDNESLFLLLPGRWIPGGFPGEIHFR